MCFQALRNGLSSKRGALLVFFISLILKILYVHFFEGNWHQLPAEGSDAQFYHGAALNLMRTGTYGIHGNIPTVEMPPGQSFFLYLIYKISGGSLFAAKIGQILLMSAVAALSFLTAVLFLPLSFSLLTGLLVALDPAQTYLAGTFLSEPLFIFFMTLGIYLFLRNTPIFGWENAGPVLSGISFGLAGLTRNQGWLFTVFMAGMFLIARKELLFKKARTVLLVTAMMIFPWTARNYYQTGHFILVSAEGGLTLWASNNPDFVKRPPMPMSLPIYKAPEGLSQLERDSYYRQKALNWIVQNPLKFIRNGVRKIYVLYHYNPMSWRSDKRTLYRLAGIFPYALMLPFIGWGFIKSLKLREFQTVLLYVLFTTLLTVLFYGDSRIRAPIQPYLYLIGVVGIKDLIERLKKSRKTA